MKVDEGRKMKVDEGRKEGEGRRRVKKYHLPNFGSEKNQEWPGTQYPWALRRGLVTGQHPHLLYLVSS